MPEQISQSARRRLSEFSRRIAVSRQLDQVIGAELCSHMEDKLLAYLDGREKLNEDDALLLVERHFGDPAMVQGMFRRVHGVGSDSLARRLAAVSVLNCLLFLIIAFLSISLNDYLISQRIVSPFQFGIAAMCAGLIAYVVAPVAAVCVLWIMLMRWQGRVERGEQVWFMRWNAWLFAGLAIGLPLAADSLSPHHFEIWSIQYEMARRVIEVVTDVAYAAGWAWWLAQGRRHWLLPIAGAALWVVWSVALSYVHLAAGSLWIVSRDFLNMSTWLWQLAQYAAAGASLYAVVRIIARNRSASGRVSVAR